MRKKFFIVFLCLICLTAAGFELFVHKNVFYGVDTPKIQEKDTIDEKLKKAISFDNSDKDGDGIHALFTAPQALLNALEIMFGLNADRKSVV